MHRIICSFCTGLLLFSGCAPRHPEDMRAIDSLRIEIEGFLHAQAIMSYNNWVAGIPTNQDSLYRAHANLFTRPVLELVARAMQEEPDTIQQKRLAFLQRFLTLEYLARSTATLADRFTSYEGEARVILDRDTLYYRQLSALIANERSALRREQLYAAANPVLDSLNVPALEIQRTYRRLAQDLGYSSYPAMIGQLKGYSLESVRDLAARALVESDSLYFALLPSLVRESTGLETVDLHRYDFPALLRSARFDRFFPRKELVASVRDTYHSLGIDLSTQGNLSLDTTHHPGKNPRAACYAISVPGDVRISIKPAGGVDDFAALYHEMGHAEHYAHVTEQALEFKYLGEPTVTETYAFLSEYLLCNPAWLRQFPRMPVLQLKDYIRQMAFARLYMVRRYCAKFLFELAFQNGHERPDSLYAALLARTLGCREHTSDAKRYLVDLDPHYYSASYLRAWFLEAQLNHWLTGVFGVNWYENPRAGTFLASLWAQGDRLTTEDLLSQIGARSITTDAWLAEIKEMIRLAARPDRP
jgi:hypothetical protein